MVTDKPALDNSVLGQIEGRNVYPGDTVVDPVLTGRVFEVLGLEPGSRNRLKLRIIASEDSPITAHQAQMAYLRRRDESLFSQSININTNQEGEHHEHRLHQPSHPS